MNPLETSLNEYERIDQLKLWYKKYGNWIIGGLCVILLVIAGWQYWHHHQAKNAQQASLIYTQLTNSINDNNVANIEAAANELKAHYAASPYAKLAALVLAQRAVKDNNLAEAENQLRWIVKHKQQAILSQLAQIRLARVLIAENKPQQAIDELAGADRIYPAEAKAVRAKALIALGKKAEARNELQQVIETLPPDSPMLPMLEMYLNDI